MAVNQCINDYYRDQDLVPERALTDNTAFRIAWEKDRFGVARPWTQKGPEVTLPVGDVAPVVPSGDGVPVWDHPQAPAGVTQFINNAGTSVDHNQAAMTGAQPFSWNDPKLEADLTTASSPSINDWRAAFAIQRYQEARARYGSRFVEYLRYCGVRPSDARLQRAEYIAGGTARINFSEVLQTGSGTRGTDPDTLGVGDMYGHGIAGVRSNRYRKFFEEHGYVVSFLSIRPKAIYVNGVPREFLKRTKEDYFQKELASLGQQEVFAQELHGGSVPGTVFGFEDRYEEYRRHLSGVSQDFETILNSFHMGRDLEADPVLNESFIECDPTDRIFQVGQDIASTLWCMINNRIIARRQVPKRARPRIL